MRDQASSARNGFTLVELLVALTLFSVVMAGMVSGLRSLANTQTSLEKAARRVDEMRIVSNFLRDLSDAAVVGGGSGGLSTGGSSVESTYFEFDRDFFAMKSIVMFGEKYAGSYVVRVNRENGTLVLRWQDAALDGSQLNWQKAPSKVIAHDVDVFSIAAVDGVTGRSIEPTDVNAKPTHMHVHLQVAGEQWPEIVLRVPHD